MRGHDTIFLSALGIVSALGRGKAEVATNLMSGRRQGLAPHTDLLVDGSPIMFGDVAGPLPEVPARLSVYASRNARLTIAAVEEIRAEIDDALTRYGRSRIAVVMGTSTSGIAEGEAAVRHAMRSGTLPPDFKIAKQELGSVSECLARYLEVTGPAYTISTACSSSAAALAAGRRLVRTGLADAVLAGGADSRCRLTVNGFYALSALSKGICNPFSRNRDGTTLGEGAAIFLMRRDEGEIALLGEGASTDAYSMTAPEPEGRGVVLAMHAALADAGLDPQEIDYIQLHGTGTPQNDAMESKAVLRLFGNRVPCSSSKGQVGHTLGTAGAIGAAHCWLAASDLNRDHVLPPHLWDGAAADGLLSTSLVHIGQAMADGRDHAFLCNAFAFGGSNVSLILGRVRR